MKYILITLLLSATLATAQEIPPDPFVLGVPDAVFQANQPQLTNLTWNLWGKEPSKEWCMRGWKQVRRKADPTKIWWLYDITKRQIKDTLPPSRIDQLKQVFDNVNIKWEFLSLGATMDKWELEYLDAGSTPPL